MINTEPATGLLWAACDECGRPFDISGLFDAYKTTELAFLVASAREHGWLYSEQRRIVLCPAHAWLAPSTGLSLDPETSESSTRPIQTWPGAAT
jgi:hypothetical protein